MRELPRTSRAPSPCEWRMGHHFTSSYCPQLTRRRVYEAGLPWQADLKRSTEPEYVEMRSWCSGSQEITSTVTLGLTPERCSPPDVFGPCKVGTAAPPARPALLSSVGHPRLRDVLSWPPLSVVRRYWSGPARSCAPHPPRWTLQRSQPEYDKSSNSVISEATNIENATEDRWSLTDELVDCELFVGPEPS